MRLVGVLLFFSWLFEVGNCYDWESLNLLPQHIPMVFNNNQWLKDECERDTTCPYKNELNSNLCWGYEENCKERYLKDFPQCPTQQELDKYWSQADFGKVKESLFHMKKRQICKPKGGNGASLTCTKDAMMCRAKNLYLHIPSFSEWSDNTFLVPKDGAIGAYCELDEDQLKTETNLKRSLSTWGFQLQSFKSLKTDPFAEDGKGCDVILDTPVVFVQLDAVGNLYHHFCDFFNLYVTQHANNSWFGTDVQVIRWNNHLRFRDPFMEAWKAFTNRDVLSLHDYLGKKVCIPDATFAFLPRMPQGLYYSTYLEYHCRSSSMIKSFSDNMLHRLGVLDSEDPSNDVIRVTFLQRGVSNPGQVFRRVLNIDALVKRLRKIPNFSVKVVSYDFREMSFLEQLKNTRNTDIFIGMHGAGLTHFMFLPDWAVAFELYNCGDVRCYRDLAHLRGLRYMTWEDASKIKEHDKNLHSQYGSQSKFWNYSFDVEEFIRQIRKARDLLLENDKFKHLRRKNYSENREKNEL